MKKLISFLIVLSLIVPPCFAATQNNAVNSVGSSPWGITLTGVSYPAIRVNNAGTGNIDLYTVPTGKKLFIFNGRWTNTTGGTINATYQIKIGGTYYVFAAATSAGANTDGVLTRSGYVLNPGDIVSINTDASGLTVNLNGILFDSTVPITSTHGTTLSTGDNTIYTCPTGKTAFLLDTENPTQSPFNAGIFRQRNESGATRTYSTYVVPSGQSPADAYAVRKSVNVTNNNFLTSTASANLNAGDFLAINTDSGTGTQRYWFTVMEV